MPRPKPGATYLIPLDGGYFGVCRVIRKAGPDDLLGLMDDLSAEERTKRARQFHVVVTSPWVGTEAPNLDDPELRRILRLTHHEWPNAPQVYVAPLDTPPDFRFLGYITPSLDELSIKGVLSNVWTRRGQQLLQKRWDEQTRDRTPGPPSNSAPSRNPVAGKPRPRKQRFKIAPR